MLKQNGRNLIQASRKEDSYLLFQVKMIVYLESLVKKDKKNILEYFKK